ncbi:class II histone deacetylase [Mycolicibacterium sp. 050158]|uniref:class II histone deacetylase n=1 Tax=Mycolicibacterium sp. 050158 TaxID=3090602 RepID=UPI00299E8207|nr:class II histone deacetylase [Mycolicibacterium sp. 050158]MDX1892046.1 class II histone deacetylase [Mycolicibacterium sp. 050158]
MESNAGGSAGTGLYHDELCLWHSTGEAVLFLPVGGWLQPLAGGGHPESPESKRRLKSLLDVSGLTGELTVSSAVAATVEDLLRVHTADYVERFQALSAGRGGEIGPEALFSHGGFEIASLSAGLAKQAVADVLDGRRRNAYSLSRPPGHHCLPDTGMGFCLLANIPIAIEAAKASRGLGKVAVLDWDVHHGNGTQHVYYQRDDVLTISLHQENCFPVDSGAVGERGDGPGRGFNLNVPLPPGSGHDTYLHAMRTIVLPALEEFGPELIIVASGLDANAVDPLARQLLHAGSFREMTGLVLEAAEHLCDGRLVVVHEGGYAESAVPFCGLAIIETLAGVRTEVVDPFEEIFVAQQPTARVVEYQCAIVDDIARELHLDPTPID